MQSNMNCMAARSVSVVSGCHTRSISTYRSFSASFAASCRTLVSKIITLPFSQYLRSSPTPSQHLLGGTSTPRCAVRTKLLMSEWALMLEPAPILAKRASVMGTFELWSSAEVLGKSFILSSSHSSRSNSPNVFHCEPYAFATCSPARGPTHALFAFSIFLLFSSTPSSSALTSSNPASSALAHSTCLSSPLSCQHSTGSPSR
mmetsp:Transcript_81804/g.231932  ORF Transcript_81804/g.231932 Transcript_81804/m.231932 type:complete len:203 (-) Transcript_81804:126-734(-)